ncbi:MAG: hypothetical protein AAF601_11255 [Pseudomonadota bacterium]
MICSLILALSLPTHANAAPTGGQICTKMIADGRGGGLDQAGCLCLHRVSDAVLDDDIKALLFASWYDGTDNMQAIEQLPRQNRVRRQMRTLQRSIEANCG